MKIALVIMSIVLLPAISFSATDYTCMSKCSEKGYLYDYCKEQCSYDTGQDQQKYSPAPYQPIQRPKQTDYTCMNNCSQAGYMYNLCKERCSY